MDVHTATLTSGGSTLLPPVFARTLLGNSSYQGTNVQACSQAEWGPPAAATTDALTISACEWDQDTQQGADFAPAPPYLGGLPAATFDQVLTPTPGNGGPCATEPAGADAPGTFGWTNDATGNCTLPVSGPSFSGAAGDPMSPACELVLQNAQQSEVPIPVPVYVSYDTATYMYSLLGFADFVVTGYYLPGFAPAADWLNPANTCPAGPNACIDGYFVQGLSTAAGNIAGPNLGLSIIDLTG